MSDEAWTIKRFFPFDPATPDLDGATDSRGAVGFGPAPRWLCGPNVGAPPVGNRAEGWNPIIKSIGYMAVQDASGTPAPVPGPGAVHDVTMQFVSSTLQPGDTKGTVGGTVQGQRWAMTFFDQTAVNVYYATGLPVPMDENGSPFGLRIVTGGQGTSRTGPSMVVIDFQWGRAVRDTSAATERAGRAELAAELGAIFERLLGQALEVVG